MRLAVLTLILATAACQRAEDKKITAGSNAAGSNAAVAPAKVPGSTQQPKADQVTPPIDIASPPMDAVKTSSGLIYKKLTTLPDAAMPKRNDTVLITYTGWRQTTGETFFSNKGKGQPIPLVLANTAPGFTEAMQLIGKGEKAMLWLPPSIGYKGTPPAGTTPEMLVYEVEVADILRAPAVPAELAPPATAPKLKSGLPYAVVTPGTGKDKARTYDTVTFNYTAWDKDGRMFDSTEMRKRPATVPPYRQSEAMEDILTSMLVGERMRVWIPSEKMQLAGKVLAGMPDGLLTYEVELIQIAKGNDPPPTPSDVAKPPSDAKKTEKGVLYKVLRAGKGGPHPTAMDSVKVHYTGWTTNGRMFDSSVIKNEPAEFSLSGVMIGWTEGIRMMSVGDKFRFWIPDELAYKGQVGRPAGMLVFEIELLEIKAPPPVEAADGPPRTDKPKTIPAPPDVAKPPADAKQSPKGVFYKILKPVAGAAHPTASSTVKVNYTGWTTDGKMFDSSVTKGRPYETSLGRVIAGWADGIPMIGVGESARLWIPQELAYAGGGGPQGMLVFDVDLLEIQAQ